MLIFVSGPRQVGKTTLIRQALADIDVEASYVAVDVADGPPAQQTWPPTVPGLFQIRCRQRGITNGWRESGSRRGGGRGNPIAAMCWRWTGFRWFPTGPRR